MNRLQRHLQLGLAATCVLTILMLYGWLGSQIGIPGISSDSVVYLYQALFYRGGSETGLGAFVTDYNFPPLYPLWLALWGGGAGHLVAAGTATALAFATAAVTFLYLATRDGLSLATTALLTLFAFTSLEIVGVTRNIGSECVYMMCAYSALAVAHKHGWSGSRATVLAGLIAGAILSRTIGISLLPVLALYQWRWRKFHLLSWLIAVGPAVAWATFNKLSISGQPTYLGYLIELEPLKNLPSWVETNAGAYYEVIGRFLGVSSRAWFGWFPVLFLGLAAIGMWSSMRRGSVIVWHLLTYLAIIILWPYPTHAARFLLPAIPLLVLQAAFGLKVVSKQNAVIQWGAAMLIVVLIGINIVALHQRLRVGLDDELAYLRFSEPFLLADTAEQAERFVELMHRMILTAEASRRVVPAGECVLSVVPHLYYYYSGVRAKLLDPDAPAGTVETRLREDCGYLFVTGFRTDSAGGVSRFPLGLPMQQGSLELILVNRGESGDLHAALLRYLDTGARSKSETRDQGEGLQ